MDIYSRARSFLTLIGLQVPTRVKEMSHSLLGFPAYPSFSLDICTRKEKKKKQQNNHKNKKKGIPLSISSVNPPPQSTPADVNWKICWPCFVAPSFPPRLARCQLSIGYCLSRGWRTYSVGVSPLLFVPDVLIDCSAHSASMS